MTLRLRGDNKMGTRTTRRTALHAILTSIALTAASQGACAGPDQATKDRCTAYAQRAVQQYRLMKSHPECQANTDPMNWQDNYDNHYNACVVFPQKMAEMADAARENHLQACGALSDSSAAGAAGGSRDASGANSTAATGGAAPVAPAAGGGSTGGLPKAASNDPECHSGGGGPSYPLIPGTGVVGSQGALVGNVLTFVVAGTKKRVSYAVVRPHFVLVQIHCTGKPNDNTGTWVYASPDGKSGKEITLDGYGHVGTTDMTGAVTQRMIQGK
jgi:hypothetical protein